MTVFNTLIVIFIISVIVFALVTGFLLDCLILICELVASIVDAFTDDTDW